MWGVGVGREQKGLSLPGKKYHVSDSELLFCASQWTQSWQVYQLPPLL